MAAALSGVHDRRARRLWHRELRRGDGGTCLDRGVAGRLLCGCAVRRSIRAPGARTASGPRSDSRLPGVAAVEGRVVGDFRLELGGGTEPVAARFVSLSWPAELRLDRPELRAGRDVEAGRADEVMVDEGFADAWGLIPGSTIIAVIDGRRAVLHVVGVAISPEFVWAPAPRTGLADPRHFGVVWMDGDALAKVTGLVGAFDDVIVQLAVGADPQETIDRIDRLLEPYGGLGAVDRGDQPSSKLVDQKIGQLARLARSLPVLFLAVAVFLLNVLLSRIIGTQREQIATLKALGYRTREPSAITSSLRS